MILVYKQHLFTSLRSRVWGTLIYMLILHLSIPVWLSEGFYTMVMILSWIRASVAYSQLSFIYLLFHWEWRETGRAEREARQVYLYQIFRQQGSFESFKTRWTTQTRASVSSLHDEHQEARFSHHYHIIIFVLCEALSSWNQRIQI